MRTVVACSLGIGLALAGCKPDPSTNPVDSATAPDAFVATWWTPEPGEASDWDIQLVAPFDIAAPRQMYMLDLWDVVPAVTMIDYSDGMPAIEVPAGANAAAIATLHARTPRPIVVCHVGMGAIRIAGPGADPDASKFPGFEAAPPNDPTPPKAGSVIGWSTPPPGGVAGERFLDLRAAAREIVKARIAKRIGLAKQIGCDAIAADYNDSYRFLAAVVGFDIALDDYTSWVSDVTSLAHALELSVGWRDRGRAPLDEVAARYDWAVFDRCAEFGDCNEGAKTFRDQQKAAFALEYDTNDEGAPNTISALCNELSRVGISDEVIKNAALDSAFRMTCP